jgi:hypothetical protein
MEEEEEEQVLKVLKVLKGPKDTMEQPVTQVLKV